MGSRGTTLLLPKEEEGRVHVPKTSNNHPYTNRPYHPKPKKTLKKRNLVPLIKPDRSKLSKPRKINVQKLPTFTSQLKIPDQGSHRCDTQCVNQYGPHARQSADEHSIHTITPFIYSLYKSQRRFRILCSMHTVRQRLSR